MAEEFTELDLATLLRDDEAIEDFLNDAFEEMDDNGYIAHAIGIAARAKRMIASPDDNAPVEDTLSRSFGQDEDPSLKSTIAVLRSLGFVLSVKPISEITAHHDETSEAAE